MLYLSKEQLNQLIEHSKKESPHEACGILAGPPTPVNVSARDRLRWVNKERRVAKIYQMTNTDKSAKTFFMDPKEQLKVMKEIRNQGLEMIGIYHSHPETQAYPSAHDVELAFYSDASYVIVSLKEKDTSSIRSFKIVEGKIRGEEVKIE